MKKPDRSLVQKVRIGFTYIQTRLQNARIAFPYIHRFGRVQTYGYIKKRIAEYQRIVAKNPIRPDMDVDAERGADFERSALSRGIGVIWLSTCIKSDLLRLKIKVHGGLLVWVGRVGRGKIVACRQALRSLYDITKKHKK